VRRTSEVGGKKMKDKKSIFELEEQEALELLESIKKAQDQEKKLSENNAFVYFCLWLSFNNPQVSKGGRVKVFPFPTPDIAKPF
jgi:hypothetical protein